MFQVSVVNLSADARTPIDRGGLVDLGSLSAGELTALLGAFVEVDAADNMKADSEIRVQYRRNRFIVRTGGRKLFLQDARNLTEPAYVLTPPEIIAELDGSAAAKRTVPPMPINLPRGQGLSSTPSPRATVEDDSVPEGEDRRWRWGLLLLVFVLGGYVGYSKWSSRATAAGPAAVALPASERITQDAALTGVYMTGADPGHHGIIILGDGKLKLFRVNTQAAPGVIYGTYKLGRLDGKLCLATDQPGGNIKVLDGQSLEFCNEVYKRIP